MFNLQKFLDIASKAFQALFAEPRSFFNTTFGAITNKAKLVELLKLCHVFLQRNEEDFWVENTQVLYWLLSISLYTKFLSAKITSSLRPIPEMRCRRRHSSRGDTWWKEKFWRSYASIRHHDEGNLALRILDNLLPKNVIKTCSCYQYLFIARKTPVFHHYLAHMSHNPGQITYIYRWEDYKLRFNPCQQVQIPIDAPQLPDLIN